MGRRQCPSCKRYLKGQYSWRGWLWAILCFPCGLFCCIRRRRRRCSSCESQVIVADGSVPKMTRSYKDYRNSKWQFPVSKAEVHTEQQQKRTGGGTESAQRGAGAQSPDADSGSRSPAGMDSPTSSNNLIGRH